MACKVVTSAGFDERFEFAVEYRLEYVGRRSAQKLVKALEEATSLLEQTPLVGALVDRDSDEPQPEDLRWVVVDSYIAVYRHHADDGMVMLEDIFYSSEDWRSVVGN